MASLHLKQETVTYVLGHLMKRLASGIEWVSQRRGEVTIEWPDSAGGPSSPGRPTHGGRAGCAAIPTGDRADAEFFFAIVKAMKHKGRKRSGATGKTRRGR